MIWGLVVGAIGCNIAGAFVGWDVVSTEAIALAERCHKTVQPSFGAKYKIIINWLRFS